MLPCAIALKPFQPVGVERSKVGQRRRGIQDAQALFSLAAKRLPLAYSLAGCEALRVLVTDNS